jgi:hypothetical protein
MFFNPDPSAAPWSAPPFLGFADGFTHTRIEHIFFIAASLSMFFSVPPS